jgi:polygalacturonase
MIKKLNLLALAAMLVIALIATAQDKEIAAYVNRAPFKMPAITEPHFAAAVFNILDYGAKGDGQTLNTKAVERAITACTTAGGGTVLVPPGLWLTGPIELKSNVNFRAEKGALILFSADHTLYPMDGAKARSPISGSKLENVALTGEGIYDGAGDTWRPLKKNKAAPTLWNDLVKSGGALSTDGTMWWPTKQGMDGEAYLKKLKGRKDLTPQDYEPARDFLRPVLVSIQNCKNVLVDGPTFKNSPNFAFNPKGCTNMIVRNVTINNEYYAQNGDAMDISVCKNVIIYHCTINAGDDGICMKSSGAATEKAGLENIIIADNTVYHAHGGFVAGSNTDGGMNNIWVTNCNFVNTDVGIRIKSNKGRGGLVHNVYIDHIFMHDILNEAILFSSYYEDTAPGAVNNPTANDKTPEFRDFHIKNVYCNNAKIAVSIVGLPDVPVNHIDFTDITISAQKAFYATEASDIELKNFKIISPDKTVYTLNNAGNIHLNTVAYEGEAKTFLSAEGKISGVTIVGTPVEKFANGVKLGSGVAKGAVVVQ